MPLLAWTEELELGVDLMDTDHAEFVALLNRLNEADDAAFGIRFAELVGHTRAHFERENALMEENAFPARIPHRNEHDRVLAELDEMGRRLAAGDVQGARAYVRDTLPAWFVNHRNTMDFVTAQYLLGPSDGGPACGGSCVGCGAP